MLKEQAALDDKKDLFRVIESQGEDSPMRSHLARQIRNRMREEKEREGVYGDTATDTATLNIRKHMNSMQAARRDLSEQKRKVQDVLNGPEVKQTQWAGAEGVSGLSCDIFRRARAGIEHEHEEAETFQREQARRPKRKVSIGEVVQEVVAQSAKQKRCEQKG